jgi:hypothetical protein
VVTLGDWMLAQLPAGRITALVRSEEWKLPSAGRLTVEKQTMLERGLASAEATRPDALVIDGAFLTEGAVADFLRSRFEQLAFPVYLLYRDATAASPLLDAWAGRPSRGPVPIHPGVLVNTLAGAGLVFGARSGGWNVPSPPLGLSGEVHAFLTQVRPQAAEEFVLVRLQKASTTPAVPTVGGVSVLLWAMSPVAHELDEAIFSLIYQEAPPLEIVLCLGTNKVPLREAEWHQEAASAGVDVIEVSVRDPPSEAALLNTGLERARGRYVAFLASNAIAFPGHLHRLRAALSASEQACALAGGRYARVSRNAEGYIVGKFQQQGWSAQGWPVLDPLLPSRLMVDRDRAAPIALFLRGASEAWRDSFFPALFGACEPTEVEGPPSVELRVADTEAKLPSEDGSSLPVRLLRRASRRELWRPSVLLRYRAADALNNALKSMFPSAHRLLRRRVARRLGPP